MESELSLLPVHSVATFMVHLLWKLMIVKFSSSDIGEERWRKILSAKFEADTASPAALHLHWRHDRIALHYL